MPERKIFDGHVTWWRDDVKYSTSTTTVAPLQTFGGSKADTMTTMSVVVPVTLVTDIRLPTTTLPWQG